MNPKKLVVWSELSRLLCGSRTGLSKNRISQVQKQDIEKLMDLIQCWWKEINAKKN